MELSSNYIYERLPLILLFATGYILYRVVTVVGLPEYLAVRAVRFSRGRVDLLLLSLMTACAGLSMFIPNAITVLAMLPVIRKLDSQLVGMTTPLTLSVIYGANIGGMGSLIGSPANLLLIAALDYFNVSGGEKITFFNWFEWALPLVSMFLLLAWGVVRYTIPYNGQRSDFGIAKSSPLQSVQSKGLVVFAVFLFFWGLSSIAVELLSAYRFYEPMVAVVFTIIFCGYVFSSRILSFKALIHGVPKRGLLFLGILGILIALVRMLSLDEWAAHLFIGLLEIMEHSGKEYTVYLATALTVILLTEVLSNTVVSTAFFAVIVHVASEYGFSPLPLMILVSAASTCAFMTPIATPCNSLAVGEMRGISLRSMVFWGLVLNLLGALMMSAWIWKIVPLVYG